MAQEKGKEMIRRSAHIDPSAGCYRYDRPLERAIEEYKEVEVREGLKTALEEAFKEGERVGYLRGRADAHRALNPSSEESR